MLVGYVSDEHYIALGDVLVELIGAERSYETRSRASGAIHVDAPSGRYQAFLNRDGYGPKRTVVDVVPGRPAQLRLLGDQNLRICMAEVVSGRQFGAATGELTSFVPGRAVALRLATRACRAIGIRQPCSPRHTAGHAGR